MPTAADFAPALRPLLDCEPLVRRAVGRPGWYELANPDSDGVTLWAWFAVLEPGRSACLCTTRDRNRAELARAAEHARRVEEQAAEWARNLA